MASGIVIQALANSIKVDSDTISFDFGTQALPLPLGGLLLNNARAPVIGNITETLLGFKNSSSSGFRFNHQTNTLSNLGELYLQSFINNTVNDLIKFTSNSVQFVDADIDLNGNKVVNSSNPDPNSPNDLVNVAYLQQYVSDHGGGGGGLILPSLGGTGIVNNNANTIKVGGPVDISTQFKTQGVFFTSSSFIINGGFSTSDLNGTNNYNLDFRLVGNTVLNLPISGTLAALQNRLDQFASPNVSLNLNSQKITNLANPTLGTDAVNQNFLNSRSISLTGNVTGSGTLTTGNIVTTIASVAASKIIGFPNNTTTFLRGDGTWTSAGGTGPGNTWTGNVIQPQYGGTGVINSNSNTMTIGGVFETNTTFQTAGSFETRGVFLTTKDFRTNGLFETQADLIVRGVYDSGAVNVQGDLKISRIDTTRANLQLNLQGDTILTLPLAGTVATILNSLDQFAIPTANVSFGNNRIVSLATPVDGTDAANKDYVLAAVSGGQGLVAPSFGGTGVVNNNANTITLGGKIQTQGLLFIGDTFITNGTFETDGNFIVRGTLDTKNVTIGGDLSISKIGGGVGNLQINLQGTSTNITFPTLGTVATLLNSLDQFVAPTTDLSFSNHRLTNLADPVANSDAATKAYVLSVVGGSSITLTGAVTGSGSGTISTTLTPITTSQITNFNAAVAAFRLDQFAAPNTSLSIGTQKLINVASGTNPTDGVNRGDLTSAIAAIPTGTVSLSGAVTGSGLVGSSIVTTIASLAASKITGILFPSQGGTGVNNTDTSTINLGGFLRTIGGSLTWNLSGTTSLTLPTTGTVATVSNRLDQFASPTANLSIGSQKLINVASGTNPTDGVNRGDLTSAIAAIPAGTVTLGGDVTGSGTLGSTIATTVANVAPSKLTGYPANNTTFLRGDGTWAAPSSGTGPGSTWTGNVIAPQYGGTGVSNNNANTITLAGFLQTTRVGGGTINFNLFGATTVLNLPTSGTVAVLVNRIDEFQPAGAVVSMGGNKIINLASGILPTDAVNRNDLTAAVAAKVTIITGAVSGTGTSSVDTLLANNILVSGATQTLLYNNNLTNLTIYNNANNYSNGITFLNLQQNVTPINNGGTMVNGIQGAKMTVTTNTSFASPTLSPSLSLDIYQNVDPAPGTATQNVFNFYRTSSLNAGYLFYHPTPVLIGSTDPNILANLFIKGGVQNVVSEDSCIRVTSSSNAAKIEIQCSNSNGKNWELRSENTGVFSILDRITNNPRFRIDQNGLIYGTRPSAFMNIRGNATATLISTGGNFVKVAAAGTLTNDSVGFTIASNRITYTGSYSTNATIVYTVSGTHNGNVNDAIQFKLYINNTAVDSSIISGRVACNTGLISAIYDSCFTGTYKGNFAIGDYVEIWCTHPTSGRSVTGLILSMLVTTT